MSILIIIIIIIIIIIRVEKLLIFQGTSQGLPVCPVCIHAVIPPNDKHLALDIRAASVLLLEESAWVWPLAVRIV
jgi:hypothetical protein